MGLDINNYSFSYTELHRIREWAQSVCNGVPYTLDNMETLVAFSEKAAECRTNKQRLQLTAFPELLCHCDCQGYYSTAFKGIDRTLARGNLTRLKEEVIRLNAHRDKIREDRTFRAWDCFYRDVMAANKILRFS